MSAYCQPSVIKNIPLAGPNYEEKFREFFEGAEGELGGETWAPIKSFDFMGLVKSVLSDVHEKTRTLAVSFASSKACQRQGFVATPIMPPQPISSAQTLQKSHCHNI